MGMNEATKYANSISNTMVTLVFKDLKDSKLRFVGWTSKDPRRYRMRIKARPTMAHLIKKLVAERDSFIF
ncbi:hypothetical protein FD08_GL002513 [Lentilactobacillus parakefiri DSM 10551]|nr:hypothetical protein FD08_GL002513 [Lentilactobacillus parakefiri DSM 10551]